MKQLQMKPEVKQSKKGYHLKFTFKDNTPDIQVLEVYTTLGTANRAANRYILKFGAEKIL